MQLGGKAICVSQSPSDLLLRPETRAVKKLSQYEWERPLDCYRALRPNRATRREPSTDSSGLTSVRLADHPPGVVGASSLTANALAKCDRFHPARQSFLASRASFVATSTFILALPYRQMLLD